MKKTVILTSMIAALSVPAMANDFAIATGSEGGGYEALGKKLAVSINKQARKQKVDFDFEIINTNGSVENIDLLSAGDVSAAIVQADALNVHKPSVPFRAKTAYSEKVFWLYNKKNGYEDLEDVEGKKDVRIVMVDDSGATVTMQSFAAEDKGYQVNYESAIYGDDLYDAVDMVSEGKADGKKLAGVLYVGKSIPSEIAQDFKATIGIGEATDSDFNDAKDVNGDALYKTCKIERGELKGLEGASFGAQKTVCVDAMVIYSTDFEKRELKAIKKGAAKAVRGL